MMSVAGMAVYFLETAMGQFASLGAITVWRMSPFFKGNVSLKHDSYIAPFL